MAKTKNRPKPEKKKPATKKPPVRKPKAAAAPPPLPPTPELEIGETQHLLSTLAAEPDGLSAEEQAMVERHHQTISPSLVRLTHEEFKQAIVDLGVTQTWLGAWLGSDRHQINRWAREATSRPLPPVPYWMSFVILLLQHELSTIEPVWKRFDFPLEAKFPPPLRREDAEPDETQEAAD